MNGDGHIGVCTLVWTTPSLTLEHRMGSFPTDQPNYWMLLDEERRMELGRQ